MAGLTVRELANAVGGTVHGPDDILITGAASVADAASGDVVLAESPKYLAAARASGASAVVTTADSCGDKPVIQVDEPRWAFAEILDLLAPEIGPPEPGVDPTSKLGECVRLGEHVSVGSFCWIGDDVTIGEGAVLHPFVYVGDGVRIGSHSVIYPHVTIYPGSELGSWVTVHAGTVIGSDGFGYIPVGGELHKVPQIGKVAIEDDVEIGANVTIDRAKTGATRIGRGTKIDNLVQIAHNVKIGENCTIVGQVGLSGSVEVGSGVTMGGQAGVKDHVSIGDGAVLAARAGVVGDLEAGQVYSGYPARPHKEQLRAQAAFLRLPDMHRALAELRKEIDRLKGELKIENCKLKIEK